MINEINTIAKYATRFFSFAFHLIWFHWFLPLCPAIEKQLPFIFTQNTSSFMKHGCFDHTEKLLTAPMIFADEIHFHSVSFSWHIILCVCAYFSSRPHFILCLQIEEGIRSKWNWMEINHFSIFNLINEPCINVTLAYSISKIPESNSKFHIHFQSVLKWSSSNGLTTTTTTATSSNQKCSTKVKKLHQNGKIRWRMPIEKK